MRQIPRRLLELVPRGVTDAHCAAVQLHKREGIAGHSCVISLQEGKWLPRTNTLLPPAAGSIVQLATRLHRVQQAQQTQVSVVRVCAPFGAATVVTT